MQALIGWLTGRKTYILSLVVIVYAVLAYFKVLPEPNVIAAAFVVIAGYAVTFRAALGQLWTDVPRK
jgi:hypothetical protein